MVRSSGIGHVFLAAGLRGQLVRIVLGCWKWVGNPGDC
jgi:hypothetical protein